MQFKESNKKQIPNAAASRRPTNCNTLQSSHIHYQLGLQTFLLTKKKTHPAFRTPNSSKGEKIKRLFISLENLVHAGLTLKAIAAGLLTPFKYLVGKKKWMKM